MPGEGDYQRRIAEGVYITGEGHYHHVVVVMNKMREARKSRRDRCSLKEQRTKRHGKRQERSKKMTRKAEES